MLLAGNAPPVTPSATSTLSPVQAPIPKSSSVDSFVVNQCHNTTPTLPSPISITSHCGSQPAGVSSNTNGVTIIKSIGVLPSPSNKAELSKFSSSIGSVPATFVQSGIFLCFSNWKHQDSLLNLFIGTLCQQNDWAFIICSCTTGTQGIIGSVLGEAQRKVIWGLFSS